MRNEMESRIIKFLENGGIIYSGPKEGAPPFWNNGRYHPVIRQEFLTLTGERIEGLGNAAFQFARRSGILGGLSAIRRYQVEIHCPGSTIVATASFYHLRRDHEER